MRSRLIPPKYIAGRKAIGAAIQAARLLPNSVNDHGIKEGSKFGLDRWKTIRLLVWFVYPVLWVGLITFLLLNNL